MSRSTLDTFHSPSVWRWWVCGLLLLATTLNYLDRVALNQTASDIKSSFALNDYYYAWLESGFQLAFAVGALLTGFLVDRLGVRWMYVASVVGWSAAGFLTGYSQSYAMLFACRVTLGVFEAGNWPCGIRTIRQIMPPEERSLGSAIFQSGTGLGAMFTPVIIAGCLMWANDANDPNAWRLPFRVIGVIGIGWVLLWVLTVPASVLDSANAVGTSPNTTTPPEPFYRVFFDKRFWLLVVLIIGVNTTWHTFRLWLPLFLEKQLLYSKPDVRWISFAYYAIADVGSWVVGLSVVLLTRSGVTLHASRMTTFSFGVVLVLPSTLLPFYQDLGETLTMVVIFVTGFGALGLFATYFALSQEISGPHQGKVTGTLGCINSLYLAGVYLIQGKLSDVVGGYDRVLAFACVPALTSLFVLAIGWPNAKKTSA